MTASEDDIKSRFFTYIEEYIESNETPFTSVVTEHSNDAGFADIYAENPTGDSLVLELKNPDEFLLDGDHIRQSKGYADAIGFSKFALANEHDLFLFDHDGTELNIHDIDFYHLNLREFNSVADAVPSILGGVRNLHHHDSLSTGGEKERVLALMRSFHSSVYPNYVGLVGKQYANDRMFKQAVEDWASKNNYENKSKDEQFDILAQQFTYLLVNKIFFYKMLEESGADEGEDTILNPLNEGIGTDDIRDRLEQGFERVLDINYDPIFNHDDEVFDFDIFPSNKVERVAVKELLDNFQTLDVSDIDEDLIGQLYEELIPVDTRKELGQFYTPPAVAAAIVQWATPDDLNQVPTVLDPASGSGTFPVEIYNYLDTAYVADHQEILDSISVCDINSFPIHLTGLNLAGRNISEKTNHINSHNCSFFDFPEPDESGLFDAVVGNPPYIESGQLSDKDHFREHLKSYKPEGNKKPAYYNGVKKFSMKSDAYVYFITNAIRYLKEGGRLGVIIPDKFLSAKYGEDFQQFLFDQTKIESVVTFSHRTFEDALVNGCLLLVEKSSNEQERRDTITNFIRIEDKFHPEDLVSTVASDDGNIDGEVEFEDDEDTNYTYVSMAQSEVESRKGKLSYLLKAPKEIIDLIHSEKFVTLSDCANVSSGNKTGANGFFFLDSEDAKSWGIDSRFLTPAIKSIRNVDSEVVTEEDVDLYLLNLNEFVDTYSLESEEATKRLLQQQGYTSVLKYIEYGERDNAHTGKTCSNRSIWFNINNITAPDLLQPNFYSERIFSIMNVDGLVPSDAIQCIDFTDDNGKSIAAITNSYLYKILLENWARVEGGGALQLKTYELQTIPFPDVSRLSSDQLRQLEASYENIATDNYQGLADEVLIDALELDMSVGQLKRIQENLVQSRVKGVEADPLIRKVGEVDGDMTVFEEFDADKNNDSI